MAILAISSIYLQDQYLLVSFTILLIGLLPMIAKLENRSLDGREIVLIAILSAFAAVSRVPFSWIPSVQPSSMIIMSVAWIFGPEIGWITGANVALVSNMFLGQGPWTPWQMVSWGLIGYTAGRFRQTKWMKSFIGKLIFGFVWGFLFGWIMNLWVVSGGLGAIGAASFLQVYIASFYFDLAHAVSNVIFIWFMWKPMEKILRRFQVKYGLLSQ